MENLQSLTNSMTKSKVEHKKLFRLSLKTIAGIVELKRSLGGVLKIKTHAPNHRNKLRVKGLKLIAF